MLRKTLNFIRPKNSQALLAGFIMAVLAPLTLDSAAIAGLSFGVGGSIGPISFGFGSGGGFFGGGMAGGGIGEALCTVVLWITEGGIGQAIASLAVIFLGVQAFFGKVNWGTALLFTVGIFAIFGAQEIVFAITGGLSGGC